LKDNEAGRKVVTDGIIKYKVVDFYKSASPTNHLIMKA